MTEKNFYASVREYTRDVLKHSCAIELKVTKTNTLPYSNVQVHQRANLRMVKEGNFVWKISDAGFEQKPFDIVALCGVPAYVAIIWYKPYKKKIVYFITIDDFERWEKASKTKSITEEEAVIVASYKGELK